MLLNMVFVIFPSTYSLFATCPLALEEDGVGTMLIPVNPQIFPHRYAIMKPGDFVDICIGETCAKMIVDENGNIRPLKEGEDGESVETICLIHPE